MKKQKPPRKIEIHRETLLLLDRESLEPVQGGGRTTGGMASDTTCPD